MLCHAYLCLHMQPDSPARCTPRAVRQAARSKPATMASLDRMQQLVPLLSYCLSDLDLAAGPAGEWQQQLEGLCLLPLADGVGQAEVRSQPLTADRPPPAATAALVLVVTDNLDKVLVGTHSEFTVRACTALQRPA